MKHMVSVIIPAYNVSAYINRCIQSVVSQSLYNWEIIAIDDNSSDDTWQKLQMWCECDHRVKVHRNSTNLGVVLSRNNAVAMACGDFLFFLDGDDYLPTDALQALMDKMLQTQADLCLGSYTLVWEETGRKTFVNHKKDFFDATGCMKYCLKHGETFLPIKLYKTTLYREHVHIPSDVIIQEDTIGIAQYLEHAKKVTFTSQNIYYYWKHPGTATSRMTSRHISSLLKVAAFLRQSKMYESLSFTIDVYRARIVNDCLNSELIDESQQKTAQKMKRDISCAARLYTALLQVLAKIKKQLRNIRA